ncbi:hypothetical protein TNCV_4583591 [Trichonephila clavipes]|nr:hypothetical protein TNCV_4583591 [Trichonephila clavipes]
MGTTMDVMIFYCCDLSQQQENYSLLNGSPVETLSQQIAAHAWDFVFLNRLKRLRLSGFHIEHEFYRLVGAEEWRWRDIELPARIPDVEFSQGSARVSLISLKEGEGSHGWDAWCLTMSFLLKAGLRNRSGTCPKAYLKTSLSGSMILRDGSCYGILSSSYAVSEISGVHISRMVMVMKLRDIVVFVKSRVQVSVMLKTKKQDF